MKLNYKRTILVGFAFFLISAFWQAYDATIPVILTNKFGMSQTWSGVIMALDNILAVFMLPMFGAISDKTKSKRGKRTPFITVGTIVAAVSILGLAVIDQVQLTNIAAVSELDSPKSLQYIYDAQKDNQLQTPDGQQFVLRDIYTADEFMQIKSTVTDPETGKSKTTEIPFPPTDYFSPSCFSSAEVFPTLLFPALKPPLYRILRNDFLLYDFLTGFCRILLHSQCFQPFR